MRASGEVEQEARAELSRKKAELLRVQQELNRKLKQADKQRSKRKKLNQSVLNESEDKGSVVVQKNVNLKPLDAPNLPFSIRSSTKLICNHLFNLKEPQHSKISENPKVLAAKFLFRSTCSDICTYTPLNYVSGILVQTKYEIFTVDTETWSIKSWKLSSSDLSDFVVLDSKHLLGINRSGGKIYDLETSKLVYKCESGKIDSYCYTSRDLYISVSYEAGTPCYYINILQPAIIPKFDNTHPHTQSLNFSLRKQSQITCSHAIVSLQPLPDKVVGTSVSTLYIWSRDGHMLCELALSSSELLVCRATRFFNNHTFLAVSSGETLYSIVLNQELDNQKLVSEIQTQGNVFISGFYAVCEENGRMSLFNMVTEGLSAKFDLTGLRLLDVSCDFPYFLCADGNEVLLCQLK